MVETHKNQHDIIQEQALSLVKDLGLTIIPICPHDHAGVSDQHKEKCNTPGKMPMAAGWSSSKLEERVFPSLKDIKRHFVNNPDINIGLVLGQTPNYNIVGVDVDGEEGLRKWDELCKGRNVPVTWEFFTGGNGYRLLFKLPHNMVTKKHKITLDGDHQEIAFICQGQQTILPPSIHHSGSEYMWVEGRSPWDVDLADCPDWIIEKVKDTPKAPTRESKKVTYSVDPVGAGERNNDMTKKVMSMCRKLYHAGRETALAACIATGTDPRNYNPPLEESEIRRSFEGAWTKIDEQMKEKAEKDQDKLAYQPPALGRDFIHAREECGEHFRFRNDRQKFMFTRESQGPWVTISDKIVQDMVYATLQARYGDKIGNAKNAKLVMEELKNLLISDEEVGHKEFRFGANDDTEIDNPFQTFTYTDEAIALKNGVLYIDEDKLVPWNPTVHYYTRAFNATYYPGMVNEELVADWKAQVASWVPDEDSQMFLQEYIGYCLTPSNSLDSLLFLLGRGANGKSMFMSAITQLFGPNAGIMKLTDLDDTFVGSKIIDKSLLYDPDMDSDFLKSTGKLKSIISGDMISINQKFEKPFMYKPFAKFLFNVNSMPRMGDTSEGINRRVNIIEFPNKFEVNPQYKVDFEAKFHSDAGKSAIFAWALEGLRRLKANGNFTRGEKLNQKKTEYKYQNDPIGLFMTTICEPVPEWAVEEAKNKAEVSLSMQEVYDAYAAWCDANGELKRSKRIFKKELLEHDYAIGPVSRKVKNGVRATVESLLNHKFSEVAGEYTFSTQIAKSI